MYTRGVVSFSNVFYFLSMSAPLLKWCFQNEVEVPVITLLLTQAYVCCRVSLSGASFRFVRLANSSDYSVIVLTCQHRVSAYVLF
jgi:hypothetical protein